MLEIFLLLEMLYFFFYAFSLIPGLFESLRKEGTDFADPDSTVSNHSYTLLSETLTTCCTCSKI